MVTVSGGNGTQEPKKPKPKPQEELRESEAFTQKIDGLRARKATQRRIETDHQKRIRNRVSILNSSLEEESKIPPEKAERFFHVRALVDLPDRVVADHFDELDEEVDKPDIDVESIVRKSPAVADYLNEHPYFDISREDLNELPNLMTYLRRDPLEWPMPDGRIEERARRMADSAFARLNIVPGEPRAESFQPLTLESFLSDIGLGSETAAETIERQAKGAEDLREEMFQHSLSVLTASS